MQALLVDLYELTMGESYVAQGIDERPATFQLFCRNLPPGWGYLVAAGIEDALTFLDELRFGDDELAFLEGTGLFSAAFLERLARLRFTGQVRAMREGTVFFPNEPVLEVTGPLLEAQLVETALVNVVHFQSLIAARAARCVDAARRAQARRVRPAPRARRAGGRRGRAGELPRRVRRHERRARRAALRHPARRDDGPLLHRVLPERDRRPSRRSRSRTRTGARS